MTACRRPEIRVFLALAAAALVLRPAPAWAAPPAHSRFLLGAYRKTMEIEPALAKACESYGAPLKLARAVCMFESGGNDSLTSGAGARGYFQVMPATYRLMGVSSNIEAGVKYLGEMIRQTGREDDALAAYNAGPGRLSRGRPLPMETLQYVIGVGQLRSLLVLDEPGLRQEASTVRLHRIREGQGWLEISDATKTTLLELRLYNPYLANRPPRSGQFVAYPAEPAALAAEIVTPAPDRGGWIYRTLPGDLYHHVAIALGVTYDRMREDNDLWRVQVPVVGLGLLIRPNTGPEESGMHIVVQGESVRSIASELSLDPWTLIRDNGLWDQTLETGRILRTPGDPPSVMASAPAATVVAEPVTASAAAFPAATAPAAIAAAGPDPLSGGGSSPQTIAARVHRVRRGETLSLIARSYGTTVEMLRQLNGLRGNRLSIGQRIRIPTLAS